MNAETDHGLWAPVVDAERKDRSAFGALPPPVRDRIIAGLDSGQLTLEAATTLLNQGGHAISQTALTTAYAKLRRLRRRAAAADGLKGLIRDFQARPSLDSFSALAKLLAASAAEALTGEEEPGTDTLIAASKALQAMAAITRAELERARLDRQAQTAPEDAAPAGPDLAEVLEQVYGIRR